MKKFLTVLLALSVVFTYTVGTAFAAGTTVTTADEAKAEMQKAVTEEYSARFIYNQSGTLDSVKGTSLAVDTNLTKTAIDAAIAQLILDYNTEIDTASVNGGDLTAAWTNTLGENAEYLPRTLFGNPVGSSTYAVKNGIIYTTAVAEAKTAANAKMDAIDSADYNKDDATTIKNAKLVLSNAVTAAENSQSGLATLKAAITTFDAAVKDLVPVANQDAEFAKYKAKVLAEIADLAETFMETEEARLEKELEKDSLTATEVADYTAKLANLAANVAAVEELYTGRIEAIALDDYATLEAAKAAIDSQKTYAYAKFTNSSAFYDIVDQLANVDLLVSYAEDYATAMKNDYDEKTGLAKYNAETVDAYLADLVDMIKLVNTQYDTFSEIKAYFTNVPTAEAEAKALEAYQAQAVEVITTNGEKVTNTEKVSGTTLVALKGAYAATSWDVDDQTAIKAIQKEYTLKIKVAATKEDIVALVKEAQAKMADVALTLAKKAGLKSTIDYCYATVLKYDASLLAYANSKLADGNYTDVITAAVAQAKDVLYDAVYAEKNTDLTNAQVIEILKNNYNAALAKIDAMKTTPELKAEAKAIDDAIVALPTTVTLAEKEQYLAVEAQYEAYLKLAGAKATDVTKRTLLDAYMTKLINLEKAEVKAAVKALPKVITVNDIAAVEAARAAMDAYADAYSKYDGTKADYNYDYDELTAVEATLEKAEADLSKAKLVDAAKKIAALPATITAEDAAAVKAAREAYDRLDEVEKVKFSTALADKLVAAEEALAKLEAKAVESLKIKASSSAVKGKITVKWTVKGDVPAGTVYKVYKSTKAQSGYAYMGKTTKNYMANKKNLKKGKRYFYKVKAVLVVDGVTYTSDWSNKANRFAK